MTFFLNISYAQRYEIGMFLGGNNVVGDVGNPFYVAPNHITVGGLIKWNRNERFALRANANFSLAHGATEKSRFNYDKSVVPDYNNGVGNGEIVLEWNILPYNLREYYAQTPYMFIGLGAIIYSGVSYAEVGRDPIGTQLIIPMFGYETTLTVPFGVGYKYKIAKSWVLAADLAFRYTYSDNIDNSGARNVGNLYSNDWFTTLGITLTYVFGRDPCSCGQ